MKTEQNNRSTGLTGRFNIKWLSYERFEREGHIRVPASPSRVFPLLCPVLEYEWIPDWRCTMGYSVSGVAEQDAIFHTREAFGFKAVWTCITYEPDSFIEYNTVSGKRAVVRLSLRLKAGEPGTDETEIEWRMKFTVRSGFYARILGRQFSETMFTRFLQRRERELAGYFQKKGVPG